MPAFLTSEFVTPEESAGFLLWQVCNSWQRLQRQALAQLDLTHVQFVLLASTAWLERKDKYLSQTQLATHAKTDLMMTSQVVRTLEKRKLLKRLPHPQDTRAFSLSTTAKGRKVVAQALIVVEKVDRDFFSPLGAATKQFTAYLSALR